MTTQKPEFPFVVRAFNGAMASFGGVGARLMPIDAERLMSAAQKKTGLSDFGSDYFIDPLKRLCTSFEEDARLNGLGRVMARQELMRLLKNRLELVELFKRHPEIADEEIEAPIFILGMPRTGTTSMHELMALDPQFRVPLSWEVAEPFPPPEKATYKTDPRIAKTEKQLAGIDKLLPEFKNMHPMGAELPQECVALFSHDFASMIFDVQFRLKTYQAWMIEEDMKEVFANHRRWLQLLQWKCPGDTWVLKSPQYLWNIDDMLREYPDARVVQTHRDPVKVALSIGSLVATLRSLGSDDVDLQEATQSYADLLHHGVQKTMSVRDSALISSDHVIDVHFKHFRQDPVAAMREIYDFFGLELSDSVARQMQAFLDKADKSKRHGKHRYTLEDSGLDLQKERARFRSYENAHGIAVEVT